MNTILINLMKYWNGRLTLKSAFIFVYIPISVGWYVVKHIGKIGIPGGPMSIYHPVIIVLLIVGFTVAVYRFVGLWRCSKNTQSKLLNIGAKVLALAFFAPAFVGSALLVYGMLVYGLSS